MAIEKALTERDKKLLVFLLIFLVSAAVVWFIIKPAFDDITDLNAQIATAQTTQNEIRYHISRIPDYESDNTDFTAQLTDRTKDFYPVMESQGIDNLLTNMALSFGFVPSDLRELTIQIPETDLALTPYQATGADKITTITGMRYSVVSFTLFGNRNMLQDFLNDLSCNYSAIRVTDFIWRQSTSTDDVCTLSLGLEVYMTESGSQAQ